MTLQTAQLTLFAIFASLALASWFIVKRVANFLEAAKGLSELVAWLHALAFSGEGGASIWPGHRVILHREYGHSESAQLKAAGRRAFVLLWLGDIDTAVLVVTMLVGSLRLPEFCKRPQPASREGQLAGILMATLWNRHLMKYADGTDVTLGDVVQISMRDGLAAARIVMLGDTLEHAGVDEEFRAWVLRESLLDADAVVVEWVGLNPLAN